MNPTDRLSERVNAIKSRLENPTKFKKNGLNSPYQKIPDQWYFSDQGDLIAVDDNFVDDLAHARADLEWAVGEIERLNTLVMNLREPPRVRKLLEENARLKAELWVEKDSRLRTYDGLTEKADKYDELVVENAALKIAADHAAAFAKLAVSEYVDRLEARLREMHRQHTVNLEEDIDAEMAKLRDGEKK